MFTIGRYLPLKPTTRKPNRKEVYGFDIETVGKKNKFYCATVFYSNDDYYTFFDVNELISFFKTKRFRNTYIVATNLSFDFFGCYFGKEEIKDFKFVFRGSSLLSATRKCGKKGTTIFIDTLNYVSMGVNDLGKVLGLPKLEKPRALGRKPKNDDEKRELVEYNVRDAEISKEFIEFFFKGIEEMGGTPKMTVASTAMALFKNKYLKQIYWRHRTDTLLEQFEGYYGGRTEVFERGKVEEMNYYDFNSLYPSVMKDNVFPDPNHHRICHKNTLHYINTYEGVSDVELIAPKMKHPILPFRTDSKKLVFPTGEFRGWHCHVELRYALANGYKITKVHKTHYYKKTCSPFRQYVEDMYELRMKWKKEKNAREKIAKLMMNSLYGKFGQKFYGKDEIRPFNISLEELHKLTHFERVGDFIRIKKGIERPSSFCFPIWSAYVTAYGRIKLHKAIVESNAVYADTDSIITKKEMSTSNELGALKLEYVIKEGVLVKPKMYSHKAIDGYECVKIKGVAKKLSFDEFDRFLDDPVLVYNKFTKFREAIRRGLQPNEIIEVEKYLTLEDDKRIWEYPFDKNRLCNSHPVEISDGLTTHEWTKLQRRHEDKIARLREKEEKEFIDSDRFDSHAVGTDISPQEFLENERFFGRMGE